MPKLLEKSTNVPPGAGFSISEYLGRHSSPSRDELSLAVEHISKGVAKPRHFHKISEEVFHVLSGAGFLTIDGTEYPIERGSTFLVEIGQQHFLRAADDEDLAVLLISFPAYEPSDYIKC